MVFFVTGHFECNEFMVLLVAFRIVDDFSINLICNPLTSKGNVKVNGFPANIYLYKVNNRNTRKRCEIYSNLTIKTPERHH